VVPAHWKLRQEDCGFEVSLSYKASSMIARLGDNIFKNNNSKTNEPK
jgi:hypothetical protein